MAVFLVTLFAFAVIMAAMAVGYLLQGKCLRGSCGGQAIYGPDGDLLNCDSCPVRRNGECEGHQDAR